ncbi:hypothetical protein ABZ691_30125 [Streptomyces sp. NPDC006854]|uniref:hypothetical protein n=1 Tax=Streptomyces sp. NPDC006854 TaxID=3155115 RepID=UPI003409C25C
MEDDTWPENPTLPEDFQDAPHGVYLELPSASDGLEHLAEKYAAAVQAPGTQAPAAWPHAAGEQPPGATASPPAAPGARTRSPRPNMVEF